MYLCKRTHDTGEILDSGTIKKNIAFGFASITETKTLSLTAQSLHRTHRKQTDFNLSCIETRTTASTDPHRTDRIISNAYT
ncbi:hypothetical protein SFRURICE_006903 [Spodoptera frugiperda]|nr:hypothetical protein SFRURICE_006903 [Spodoptera frugiperda]